MNSDVSKNRIDKNRTWFGFFYRQKKVTGHLDLNRIYFLTYALILTTMEKSLSNGQMIQR